MSPPQRLVRGCSLAALRFPNVIERWIPQCSSGDLAVGVADRPKACQDELVALRIQAERLTVGLRERIKRELHRHRPAACPAVHVVRLELVSLEKELERAKHGRLAGAVAAEKDRQIIESELNVLQATEAVDLSPPELHREG